MLSPLRRAAALCLIVFASIGMLAVLRPAGDAPPSNRGGADKASSAATSNGAAKSAVEKASPRHSPETGGETRQPPLQAALRPEPDAAGPSPALPRVQEHAPSEAPASRALAFTAEEAGKALEPLMSYRPSEQDIATLKEAIRLVSANNLSAARALWPKIGDKTVRKFAYWYCLRAGDCGATAQELEDFRVSNPLWPSKDTLEGRAEALLFLKETDPGKILKFFEHKTPATGAGKAALGGAYLAGGQKERGLALIREAWRKFTLDEDSEAKLLERFGKELTPADHKRRADLLLLKSKQNKTAAAERLKQRLGEEGQKAVAAQIASIRRSSETGKLLTALNREAKSEPAVLLNRIQWLRKHDRGKEAWGLFKSAPRDADALIDPADWWAERRIHVRAALNAGQPQTAYAITRNYGALTGETLAEAEFLSGWIALRSLRKPKLAHKHFIAAKIAGGLPRDRARSGYWLARTELVLGRTEAGEASLREAAQHHHTYYGQLARQALRSGLPPYGFRAPVRPAAEDIRQFTGRDAAGAIIIANKAGLEALVPVFLYDLARGLDSPGEMTLLGEFARRVAAPHMSVRLAKIAINRGFAVETYAYPGNLPQYQHLGQGEPVEKALLYAVTRQESEFNPEAVSSAGALGLMQTMPATAKGMAQEHNVKYDLKRLTADPSYNVTLGAAFLRKVVADYNGSYILALAAYNAGPGRVKKWIEQFGDPRGGKIDPVDWVERIPFTETRDYVQRIMESLQLYRSQLNGGPVLQLAEDLHRGRSGAAPSSFASRRRQLILNLTD